MSAHESERPLRNSETSAGQCCNACVQVGVGVENELTAQNQNHASWAVDLNLKRVRSSQSHALNPMSWRL